MTTVVRNTAIRLSVMDGNKVKAELSDVGETGSRSLKRIEEAARPASRTLMALDGVTGDLRGSMEAMTSRLGPLGAGLLRVGPAGLAAGAAVGGFVLALGKARTALESLDALDDTAVRLGVTTEGLQALRYGFQQTGADVEVTDAALERLGQSVGKVASLGEDAPEALRRAFARLGIDVRDTEGQVKATETVLAEMAAGIAGVQSQAERIDLARALMGRGGAALLPLLQQGADGLEDMAVEARALGVVIDEHLVKSAGEAADRLDAMQMIIDAQLSQALIDLAPVLIGAAEGFAAIARAVGSVVDSFRDLEDRSTSGLEGRLKTLTERLAAPNAALERYRRGGHDMAASRADTDYREALAEKAEIEALLQERTKADEARRRLLSAPIEIDTSRGDDKAADKAARERDRAAKDLERDLHADARVVADLSRELQTYSDERQQAVDRALGRLSERAMASERAEVERLAGEIYDLGEKKKAETEAERKRQELMRDGAKITEDALPPLARLSVELQNLNRLQAEGAISAETHSRAIADATREAEEKALAASDDWRDGLTRGFREYADEATNMAELAEDAVGTSFDGMGQAVASFAATGKLEFSSMVESMIGDLMQLTLRMAVFGPLAKAAGLGVDALFSSTAYGTTGAGTSAAGMTSGGTNSGFLLGGVATGGAFEDGRLLAAYARGGVVGGPTVFPMARGYGLMGEAGPEAVMPLKRLAGGNLGVEATPAGVTVNVINNAGAQVTTQQRRDSSGGLNIDVMIDALEQQLAGRMVRPGTPLNGALRSAANPVRAR